MKTKIKPHGFIMQDPVDKWVNDVLDDLGRFRRATNLAVPPDELPYGRIWIERYNRTFDELKGDADSFAGCTNLDELLQTEYCQDMLKLIVLIADEQRDEQMDIHQQLGELAMTTPDAFNNKAVKEFFFRFAANGEDPDEIIRHPEFRRLLTDCPEYVGLGKENLKEELLTQTNELITKLIEKMRNE